MSIRQNPSAPRLPDFSNLGVMLRTLLAVNLMALAAALARNAELSRLPGELAELAVLVEPPLIAGVLLLNVLAPRLMRWPGALARALVVAASAALAALSHALFTPPDLPVTDVWRALAWGAAAALVVLLYLDLRNRAFSPALAEARLMALSARIRPHFLFNSLNAVLGIIRNDPRRAEQTLEELSDLFRVLMRENRELAPLEEELTLCRQYLEIERLRLGERLQVIWQIEPCPPDVRIPPLILQPLLENAVYHGVEPSDVPARVTIQIRCAADQLHITLSNPYHGENAHHGGNRMALENIRERLMLFYDLEARLETEAREGRFRVQIRLPRQRSASRTAEATP